MTTLYSNSFTFSNGQLATVDTPNWTNCSGAVSVNTNAARATTNGVVGCTMVATGTVTFPADQWCQATVTAISTGDFGAPCVRLDTSANGYCLPVDGFSANNRRLTRLTAGAATVIGTVNVAPVVNDVVRIEVSGTTITAWLNGTQVDSVTDTTYSSGQAGLWFNPTNVNGTRLDTLSAGDFASSSTASVTFNATLNQRETSVTLQTYGTSSTG